MRHGTPTSPRAQAVFYLATELPPASDTLEQFIATKPRTSAALPVARTVAEIVGHIHDRELLHGGLSFESIVVDRATRAPRVRAVGWERLLGPSVDDPRNHGLGEPAPFELDLLAPETLVNERDVRAPSEVYTLGVIFYRLLTGRVPHPGKTTREKFLGKLNAAPEPPSRHNAEVPAWLDAVVLKTLAKKPEDRYRNATELARVLTPPPF